MFKSIEEIKSRLEFIKKGSIFPRRILKASKRKYQHLIKADCNQWAMPTKCGYLVFSENNDGEYRSVLYVSGIKGAGSVTFECSPYHKDVRTTHWQGNSGLSEQEFLNLFNRKVIEMNAGKALTGNNITVS